MANNQDQGQQQRAGQQQSGQQGQTVEQQRAQAQQQGGRLQSDPNQQRSGGQQQGGQQGQQGQQANQDQAQQARRAQFDEQKRAVAERPQQVGDEGQQPTPTQQENDEIRAGLRHIDDKEDDRSGADFVHNRVVRRVDADESKGKYETR